MVTTPPASASAPTDEATRQAILEKLPNWTNATGANERDQVHDLLGAPDAFVVSLEPGDGDATVRREEWTYFALPAMFEFVDGAFVGLWPVEAPTEVLIVPRWFEPADFGRDTTLGDVQAMLADPTALVSTEAPAELGSVMQAYAADQLMVVFDGGGLVYAETVPLGGAS